MISVNVYEVELSLLSYKIGQSMYRIVFYPLKMSFNVEPFDLDYANAMPRT